MGPDGEGFPEALDLAGPVLSDREPAGCSIGKRQDVARAYTPDYENTFIDGEATEHADVRLEEG